MSLLEVKQLKVEFQTQAGSVTVLKDVSFHLNSGESLGVVGESGSGKSVTSLALMGLLPSSAKVLSGEINFQGKNLFAVSESYMQTIRGKKMAMIFQDPMTSLNPCYTIGDQICEVLRIHEGLNKNSARDRALQLLQSVGIPDPAPRLNNFPHELSGGMSQRIMIAMAMACRPDLLIADEPTTALDVTIQAQILQLLKKLRIESNMALILVSHDLGVIAENSDRLMIMYAGEQVEEGLTSEIIQRPQHPYTSGLLSCLPSYYPQVSEGFRLPTIKGSVMNMIERTQGCQFYLRCHRAQEDCKDKRISSFKIADRQVRCLHPL